MDLIEELVDYTFLSYHSKVLLQICLTHFDLNFDINKSIDKVNALLNSSMSMDTNNWKSIIEQLTPSWKKHNPSLESPSKPELKPLPETLKYAFLEKENNLPVIILSSLDNKQKSKLLGVLREQKEALGWIIADIEGINLVDCMHYIYLNENNKHTRETQCRLNPNMKKVIKVEGFKLLDIGIIYPTSNSS